MGKADIRRQLAPRCFHLKGADQAAQNGSTEQSLTRIALSSASFSAIVREKLGEFCCAKLHRVCRFAIHMLTRVTVMTDHLSPSERSNLMARVRSKDTAPELAVRRIAHGLGYRFRLHRADLPGRPDIVFPKHRLAVFVHGCFWHRHPNCRRATTPASNTAQWEEKFERNVLRDSRSASELAVLGWNVLVIWECETQSRDFVATRLTDKLGMRACDADRHSTN